ncbi:MAG: carboxypeptidase regulatory-like domain-containing protein [Gammaproteobacteria bacterium]|nr:carboxypeptidase regulatory-like domain-containing protein [Gammaproteobacteria bacterium]
MKNSFRKSTVACGILCALLGWGSASANLMYVETEVNPLDNDATGIGTDGNFNVGPEDTIAAGMVSSAGPNIIEGTIGGFATDPQNPINVNDEDFYMFMVAETGNLDIMANALNPGTTDTTLGLYDSTATLVAFNDVSSNDPDARISPYAVTAGETYFVAVSSAFNYPNNTGISTPIPGPGNDGSLVSGADTGEDQHLKDLISGGGGTSGDYLLEMILTPTVVDMGSITGFKYSDFGADGEYNPTEGDSPLQGWTINLENDLGEIVATDITDSNGMYLLENLPVGDYDILEVEQVGYTYVAGNGPITVEANTTLTRNFFNQPNQSPIPEPATALLMGLGLAGLGFGRRYRKARG